MNECYIRKTTYVAACLCPSRIPFPHREGICNTELYVLFVLTVNFLLPIILFSPLMGMIFRFCQLKVQLHYLFTIKQHAFGVIELPSKIILFENFFFIFALFWFSETLLMFVLLLALLCVTRWWSCILCPVQVMVSLAHSLWCIQFYLLLNSSI